MEYLYPPAVALHVLAAVTWVGGSIFLVFALGPTMRMAELRGQASLVMRTSGLRFRRLTHASFGVFIHTGAVLLAHRSFHITPLLAAKLLLVGVAFTMSAFHDYVVGPRVTTTARSGDTAAAAVWRRRATWMGRGNLALMALVVILSTVVARGG